VIGWLAAVAWATTPVDRQLGPHDFGQPVAVEPVFLPSFVSFRQGIGQLTLRDARYEGLPLPLTLRLLGITEVLQGQLRVAPRFAITAYGSGAVLSGADADSALFLGARATYEVRLGGAARLVRTERAQLTARVGGRRSYGLRVTPADVAVELLDDTQQALARVLQGRWADSLLSTQRVWQGTVGVSGALAASEVVGVLGSVSARVGTVRVGDAPRQGLGLQVGGGAAIDLRPTSDGVLGLQVGIQDRVDRTSGLEDEVAGRHRMVVPLQIYADRGGFQLGLVPSLSLSWGSDVREQQLGLEGRAVGHF